MPAFKRPSAPSSIETRPSTAPTTGDKPTDASNTKDIETLQSPPLSPLPLYGREDRDALAMEHDRQKYFKALDRARTKARKALGMEVSRSSKPQTAVTDENSGTKGTMGKKQRKHHGAQERSVNVGDEKEFWKAPGHDLGLDLAHPTRTVAVHDAVVGMPQVEVKLVDLVQTRPSKAGGKKGSGGLGGDFEVIPHVRSVIVLDDQTGEKRGPRDMDLDEAWEYITDEEQEVEGKQRPTYATIAAAGMAV
ncbi:hypothetical protein BKA70DRAFT_307226 [Coprinopsis sp. MPI-PUGE-AT-0042]|nr:hypothetical protein BKA70DRAFT_307226 [Coprinopsis sp. MPI-PUGE-AT-0042]